MDEIKISHRICYQGKWFIEELMNDYVMARIPMGKIDQALDWIKNRQKLLRLQLTLPAATANDP